MTQCSGWLNLPLPVSVVVENIDDRIVARNSKGVIPGGEGADASTVIQAALNALLPGKKNKILFGPGRFWVHDLELPTSNITLEGVSGIGDSPNFDGTVFSLPNNKNTSILKCKDDMLKEFIVIKNIFFDGNDQEQTIAQPLVNLCLHDSYFEGCMFEYSKGVGLRLFRDVVPRVSSNVEFVGCYFEANKKSGAELAYCNSINFFGCHFEGNNNEHGITIDGGGDHGFFGSYFLGNLLNGLDAQRSTRLKLIGCLISDNGRHGAALRGVNRAKFIGTDFLHNSLETTNTYDSINLSSYDAYTHCKQNKITGCDFYGELQERYGINEENANQNYNIYLGNFFQQFLTGAINKQGVNSIDEHNIKM